ncbi:hypothetical protein ACLOJK_033816 [Asimina triloba]
MTQNPLAVRHPAPLFPPPMRWLLEASHGGADRHLAHVMVVGVMGARGMLAGFSFEMDYGCCPRWWVLVGHVAVGWCLRMEMDGLGDGEGRSLADATDHGRL